MWLFKCKINSHLCFFWNLPVPASFVLDEECLINRAHLSLKAFRTTEKRPRHACSVFWLIRIRDYFSSHGPPIKVFVVLCSSHQGLCYGKIRFWFTKKSKFPKRRWANLMLFVGKFYTEPLNRWLVGRKSFAHKQQTLRSNVGSQTHVPSCPHVPLWESYKHGLAAACPKFVSLWIRRWENSRDFLADVIRRRTSCLNSHIHFSWATRGSKVRPTGGFSPQPWYQFIDTSRVSLNKGEEARICHPNLCFFDIRSIFELKVIKGQQSQKKLPTLPCVLKNGTQFCKEVPGRKRGGKGQS